MAPASVLGSFTHGADPDELRRRAAAQRRGMESAPQPVLAPQAGVRGSFVRAVTEKLGLPANSSADTILAKVSEVKAGARASVAPGGEYPVSSSDVMSEAEYEALIAPKSKGLSVEDEATYRALFGRNA